MKTLLMVRGQSTPQHWSFLEIDGSPTEFSSLYTCRKNVQYMRALLGQNSVGGPSIIGQYLMFVRTGTHEWTTALKPIHPGTVWREKVYPKQLLLRHPYQCPSKIHHAGFRMQAFITFEPLITCPSGETSNSWTLSICTVLSDRLAQKQWFNWAFPLCLVCIDLQLRCRTELSSLKKDQCCGLGCPLTVKKSVFIYVIIVTCNLYKHTSGNVWWQYYPTYIALGNDRICNASVHCLYIIIGATLPHSTDHGDDTTHVECVLKITRRAVLTSWWDQQPFLERQAWAYWL